MLLMCILGINIFFLRIVPLPLIPLPHKHASNQAHTVIVNELTLMNELILSVLCGLNLTFSLHDLKKLRCCDVNDS